MAANAEKKEGYSSSDSDKDSHSNSAGQDSPTKREILNTEGEELITSRNERKN